MPQSNGRGRGVVAAARAVTFWLALTLLVRGSAAFSGVVVTGRVIDQVSKEGLPFATVTVIATRTGTAANSEGLFGLFLEPGQHRLRVSQIGYVTRIVVVEGPSQDITIALEPAAVELETIEVYAYRWIDAFVMDAIRAKNALHTSIRQYTAYTYSKTIFKFPPPRNEVFGMWEAVSKTSYVFPDRYQESLLHLHSPPQFRNFPYKYVSVNQQINLYRRFVDIHTQSLVSPLADDALEYYTYDTGRQYVDGADTVVEVRLKPRVAGRPLFSGVLIFDKATRCLLGADLEGNESARNATMDSIRIVQKYTLIDSAYNVPAFTRCSFTINYLGMLFTYIQDYSSLNFRVNDPSSTPTILERGNSVIIDPQMTYHVDLPRDTLFEIVFTEDEKRYKQREEEIVNSPLYMKAFLFLLADLVPLMLDEEGEVAGVRISRLSNWYHFNKVEGHFLGCEFLPFNSEQLSLAVRGGWSFGNKWLTAGLRARYRNVVVEAERAIRTLGRLDINTSVQSMSALLNHVDDMHYYASEQLRVSFTHELLPRTSFMTDLLLEHQHGVDNGTDFSLFGKDKAYAENVHIQEYRDNAISVALAYDDNDWSLQGEPIRGLEKPSLRVSAGVTVADSRLLGSTETRWEWYTSLRRIQPIMGPVSADCSIANKWQSSSAYVQKMNFVSANLPLRSNDHPLTFYSVGHYDYFCESYLRFRGLVRLVPLPEFWHFRPAVGVVVSYLRPWGDRDFDGFTRFKEDFWEYGLSLQGVSFLNLYVVRNNLSPALYVALDFFL